MRDAFHRTDLALYANGLTGREMSVQSYGVIGRSAIGQGSSGCPENHSLTANGNLRTKLYRWPKAASMSAGANPSPTHTIYVNYTRSQEGELYFAHSEV